jgi:hypothetical protein
MRIMPVSVLSRPERRPIGPHGIPARTAGLITLVGGVVILAAGMARAQQSPSPNQPLAIPDQVRMRPPCPLIVPARDAALQPLRIPPAQVPAKNAMGCLSPADAAAYGPDGCPIRLCGQASGTMPLPKL